MKAVHGGADDAPTFAFSDEALASVALAGAPVLYELHQVNRRQRAVLVRKLTDMLPELTKLEPLIASGGELELAGSGAADVMDFLADTEDLLAAAAVDAPAFRQWAAGADDTQLIALLARLAGSMNSGEASSSST